MLLVEVEGNGIVEQQTKPRHYAECTIINTKNEYKVYRRVELNV